MTILSRTRRFASDLLRLAIRIAPEDTREWGQGMLSELNHVEGVWSVLRWSLGATGVLARLAILAVFFRRGQQRMVSAAGELLSRESPMRNTAFRVIASCVAASLLFLATPTLRRALRVSLVQWQEVFDNSHPNSIYWPTPYSETLEREVEQNRDAEGIAFVALHHPDAHERVRLAERSVQLDPTLTWTYGVIAAQDSAIPEVGRWVSELEKYEPQNALPYLIAAEKVDLDRVFRHTTSDILLDPSWQSAMASAFKSPKLDTYADRLAVLEGRVMLRYGVDDPFQASTGDAARDYRSTPIYEFLPSNSAWDASRYAQWVLESGETMEGQGDRQAAREKYLTVVRFAELMDPRGRYSRLPVVQREAYQRLASLSQGSTEKEQAALYAALADLTNRKQKAELISLRTESRSWEISRWNAKVTEAGGLLIVFSTMFLVVCVLGVLVRERSFHLNSLHPSSLTLALGVGGGVGLLLGSFMLYLSYRPYAEILQRFIRTGEDSRMADLRAFLFEATIPIGADGLNSVRQVAVNFWGAVVVLCVVASLFVAWRFVQQSRGAGAHCES